MEHPRVLPLVVDCAGWNIQVREAIWSVAQPNPDADPTRLASGWHHECVATNLARRHWH